MEAEIFLPVSTNYPDQSYLRNAATADAVALMVWMLRADAQDDTTRTEQFH